MRRLVDGRLALALALAGALDACLGDDDGANTQEPEVDAGDADAAPRVCSPGVSYDVPCGICGTSHNVCGPDGRWEPFGRCVEGGECTRGAIERRACSHCGTQRRECGPGCEWSPWSGCEDEGECWPGQERSETCWDCGTTTLTCLDDCTWGAARGCVADASKDALCDDGLRTTEDYCGDGGVCRHHPIECAADQECCGGDTTSCGQEPVCADWSCMDGFCELRYEMSGADPEQECGAGRSCDGAGVCADCAGVLCDGTCCAVGQRCCASGCAAFCGGGQSDRNLKRDVESVDPEGVLEAVASMPIGTWSYIGDEPVRHMGPMAQDFRVAFGLGETDTLIDFIDEGGVSFAAIQALHARTEALAHDNAVLQRENSALRESLRALEERVGVLERGSR